MISSSTCDHIAQRVRELAGDCIDGSRKGLLVMSLGACAILLAVPVMNATGKPAAPSRPLDGSCQTKFAFTQTGAIDIQGTCHYSHLGLTTSAATQMVIPQPDNTLLITNTAVYTAANGDKLFSTFAGTGVFTATGGVSFSGTETYYTGTGRFADATGSATLVGSAEFTSQATGVGQYSVEGTISY
jgi:hypothetical protein